MTRQRHPALRPGTTAPADPPTILRRSSDEPVERAVVGLARSYLEIQCGRRAVEQLDPLLSPSVRKRLRDDTSLRMPAPDIDPVRGVIVQRPTPGRVEAVVLASRAGRTIAVSVAMRWHVEVGRWTVVELSLPMEPPPEHEQTDPDKEAVPQGVQTGSCEE